MPNARSARTAWGARDTGLLIFTALAFIFELYVLYFPNRASFTRYVLAVPDAFTDIPRLTRYALPLLFAVAACVLTLVVRKLPALVARPRRSVTLIFLLGVCLHIAMIGSLRQGFDAFHWRATHSGHSEFLYEALNVRDLDATLHDYEPYVRQHLYLSNKGPGVLIFFYSLRVAANHPYVRPYLAVVEPERADLQGWLTEQGLTFAPERVDELQHLLGLMFLVFPLLSYAPVFFIYWLGREFVDAGFGLLAALLYLFVPGVAMSVAHLDFGLFPLLVTATVALFAIGTSGRRFGLVAASAVVFMIYFVTTVGAAALMALLLPFGCLVALRRLRDGEPPRRIARDAAVVVGLSMLIGASIIALLYVSFHLDFVERYQYARDIQKNWGSADYNWHWVKANILGWLLSFGLAQGALVLVQQGRSAVRTLGRGADPLDFLALAWLCLVIGLELFGRQHGETNRMWTFLSPVACLVAARLVYDMTPSRRYLPTLMLFLVALIVARYRLSYL